MFLHFCRVSPYIHQTPCHNADLENRSKLVPYVSDALLKAKPPYTDTLPLVAHTLAEISTCVSSAALAAVAVGELNAVIGASRITGV